MASSASCGAMTGSTDGMVLARRVLPLPGGPVIIRLCIPAAATSRARLAFSCPFTWEMSGPQEANDSLASSRWSVGHGSMADSPVRWDTSSARDDTGITVMPSTNEPSLAFFAGRNTWANPSSLAIATMGRTPLV